MYGDHDAHQQMTIVKSRLDLVSSLGSNQQATVECPQGGGEQDVFGDKLISFPNLRRSQRDCDFRGPQVITGRSMFAPVNSVEWTPRLGFQGEAQKLCELLIIRPQ